MNIHSFVIGFSKGKKCGTGFFSTAKNEAGGMTYAFRAYEKNVASPDADVLSALIDRSITSVESDCEHVGKYSFHDCTALISANFPNVTSVGEYAFENCTALSSVKFPNVTSVGNYAFSFCSALTSVNFPNVTSLGHTAFSACTALTSVNFPKVTSIGTTAFRDCPALVIVDLPNVTSIEMLAFTGCYSLMTIILRSESLCTLSNTNAFKNCYHILGTQNATYNPNGDKDGYIYVPSALVDSYKSATNWSSYASQFRALEDYTVDGTITGELDPNKI